MTVTPAPEIDAMTVDIYRDIHKGIRAELFSVTGEAGRIDPGSATARAGLAAHLRQVVEVLEDHAGHEDAAIQPVLSEHLPELFSKIEADHDVLGRRAARLAALADEADGSRSQTARASVRHLYLELAAFTGAYLTHQDIEETRVLPSLVTAVGPEAVRGIHVAILAAIPPDQKARSLAFMLPAMNIDNRAEMLGEMRATAPLPAFEGALGLAAAVLPPGDYAALAERLGVA